MAISDSNVLSYVNQDYNSILDEIMETKQDLMPEYTDDTDTDFGNLILTYCAMLFDILSNKEDYSVNEAIPMLCETIKAMYKHCKWAGYRPTSNQSATCTFRVTILNEGEIQYITKGSKITMESTVNGSYVIYEALNNVICEPPDGLPEGDEYTVDFMGIQGETVEEELGESTGKADQQYELTYYPYVEGSLEMEVRFANGRSEYYTINENNSFIGTTPTDKNIVIEQIDSQTVGITFGDGINGKIPEEGTLLVAHYRTGGGAVGNRPIGVIDIPLFEMPSNFISVENITEAKGGKDAENVDDIKDSLSKGKHKMIFALMRYQDFNNFLSKPARMVYIEKFKVMADVMNPIMNHRPVAIYIKQKDRWDLDQTFVNGLLDEMEEFRLIDDTYNIYPCEQVAVKIKVSVMSDGLTVEEQLGNAIIYSIKDYIDKLEIGGDNSVLKDIVGLYADDIRNIVRSEEGVKRFISLDIMDTKYDTVEVAQRTYVSDNVYEMVLRRGQLFSIEAIETDIEVEFV